MITVTSTEGVNSFHKLLERVEQGETVRILKHGRVRARLVPDCDFIGSEEMTRLFAGYQADALDRATADAVALNIQALDQEADETLAH
jgi:prevent-host-death family protein